MVSVLSGCEKWNELVSSIKEKSPWVYAEEVDKLNNTKVFVAKKNYKNKEGTAQADTEFQCDSRKVLSFRIKSYTTKEVNGAYPGSELLFSTTSDYQWAKSTPVVSGVNYIKTRNGEQKIAFPTIADKDFSNSAHIALTGLNVTGLENYDTLNKMMYANAELKNNGYQLAVERVSIPKLFKTKDWVVEIPTENGVVVAEIDLGNQNIQKVFEVCSWKPEFLNAVVPAPAAVSSQAQSQSPAKALVIHGYESADESDEIKDFGKLVEYDYCYDGGGGPDHLTIKGDYQGLTLFVNLEANEKNELVEDKSPITFNIKGEGKVKLKDKIAGPMTGKIVIKQSKDILFEKNFTSHGCQ